MINKIDLRKAISSIAISNAKRNTIYRAFSDLDSITKEEFDSVKSDISKVVENMLTKDTVGKANGVASLDSNGSVPIEQLGNIDTKLFLIVRELPTDAIQSNKIYLVPNQDGQGNNVYVEYLYVEGVWEKVGEFKPEVDLSHIEAKLETKANITDVDNRFDDLQNYCFKFGIDGSIAAPYKEIPTDDSKLEIKTLNDNQEYTYVNVSGSLEPGDPDYNRIYDKTLDKTINITTSDDYIPTNKEGDFFKTSESLDLTHTFYLDNDKTGIVENLDKLTIEESNVFVNFPYVEINDNLDDSKVPQYIYDATDNKWIEVVNTFYASSYVGFNTEEPLDLTHEFYNNVIGNWTSVGEHSTALGCYAYSGGNESIALGCFTTVNGNGSTCLGYNSQVDGNESIVLGYNSSSKASYNVVLGRKIKSQTDASNSVAIGSGLTVNGNHAIGIGNGIDLNNDNSIAIGTVEYVSVGAIAIGDGSRARGGNSIAIGGNTWSEGNYSVCIGYRAKTIGLNSLALGTTSTTGGDYAIALGKNVSNTKSIFGVGFNGVNGIDMDRDNYGLYLKGFGGYDGTNLVVKSGDTETLNPDIKSVQQMINEKADSSSIPNKTSQLTNDSNFATEKYVADNIGIFKKIAIINFENTITGLFDENGEIIEAWLENSKSIIIGFCDNNTDLNNVHFHNTISIGNNISYKGDSNVYIGNILESNGDNSVLIGRNITNNSDNSVVIGSNNTGFTVNGYISIGYDIYPNMNAIYQIAGHGDNNQYNLEETLTYDNQHKKYIYGIGGYDGTNSAAEGIKSLQEVLVDKADASAYYTKTEIDNKGYLTAHQSLDDYAKQTDIDDVKASMGNYFDSTLKNYVRIQDISTKADLVDDKLKADQLPKLLNITTAATAEEVVTKFNALLADLKAKGYMEADTAE